MTKEGMRLPLTIFLVPLNLFYMVLDGQFAHASVLQPVGFGVFLYIFWGLLNQFVGGIPLALPILSGTVLLYAWTD
jgi:hypothetical protein